ncbi:YopX family protein, partial [Listeria monocytogenes]
FRAFVKSKKKMLPVTDLCFNETEAVGVSGCGNAKCTLCVDWYNFDDVVLMQYTGLKDKNGKKIFEGDIVAFSEDDFHVFNSQVEYFSEDGYPAFDIKVPSTYYFDSNVFSEVSMSGLYEIEVIGNIHENPELLEEK